jgi:hypothetical protein
MLVCYDVALLVHCPTPKLVYPLSALSDAYSIDSRLYSIECGRIVHLVGFYYDYDYGFYYDYGNKSRWATWRHMQLLPNFLTMWMNNRKASLISRQFILCEVCNLGIYADFPIFPHFNGTKFRHYWRKGFNSASRNIVLEQEWFNSTITVHCCV